MNCPSRADPEPRDESWNQNPPDLAADLTTRADMDQRASRRLQRGHKLRPDEHQDPDQGDHECNADPEDRITATPAAEEGGGALREKSRLGSVGLRRVMLNARRVLVKYLKFIGPGFMVSVAYIDPGNYATDVAAGASFRFSLLFMILVSNLVAIFLQSLCVKLGSVTGMNLAENCRAHLPPWLNYMLWFFAESAIIATDIAEVIGAAIALNLLSSGRIPLVAGCAISIVDVLFLLLFYNPNGGMRALRTFEFFIMWLVLGVVICFCIELSMIDDTGVGEVFRGYLPSSAIVQSRGLYQACGILGATVMPHSLYLGSGIVQSRLQDFDQKNGECTFETPADDQDEPVYRPSLSAINACLRYSVAEIAISLFTFALFINSAILITAGASLSNTTVASADLFGIYDLLASTISPAAGILFGVALLLSGISAGIVCTMAGQMVSEGQLNLRMPRWARRLFTRSLSITPSIIIAGCVGQEGLSAALEGSQVALSVILPFVSAPLLWFTCRESYMRVRVSDGRVVGRDGRSSPGSALSGTQDGREELGEQPPDSVSMKNHWITAWIAGIIWLIIVIMNGALIVLAAMGTNA